MSDPKHSNSSAEPEAAPDREQGSPAPFDEGQLLAFYERSNSAETRRAYRRVAREFFGHFGWLDPGLITSRQIAEWRDRLLARRQRPATVALKLSIVRALYEYLRDRQLVAANPATAHRVPSPETGGTLRGQCLPTEQVQRLLAGPNRSQPDGARDYALMLLMLKTSLRVGEACGLRLSSINWSHGRWLLKLEGRGGRERKIPLPKEVKEAIDAYLKLDRGRRRNLHTDGPQSFIFQPLVNYRTLEFNKPLSATQAWKIVRRWGDYTGIGKVSPHDLRRTAITRALDQGLSYRQVRMMSGHQSLEMVIRYDRQRDSLELNAVNFLDYAEEDSPAWISRKEDDDD
ncbi:MAG TPA: tyrosine-type recombinase/integrase [Blastocatellia bacterium]|nr:tyrosine-type recombinase/integrase [Blastocatellia bacterium]